MADPHDENSYFLSTHRTDKKIVRSVVGPNARTPAGREMPPGILPANGSLRTTPTDHSRGNRSK
jgi:hypothetical protein